MTFRLKPNPTFRATVQISQPGEGAEPMPVRLVFKHLSRTQWNAEIVEPKLGVEDAVRHVVVGWEEEVEPFGAERFNALLDEFPPAAQEIWELYGRELLGSKRKN